jgi:uncharacterized protein YjbI with pentapeptide repeats
MTSPTLEFSIDCARKETLACVKGPSFEHEGRHYCVLHYPSGEKSDDFKKALDTKLVDRDFNFQGLWFPDDADFRGFTFDTPVDFRDARFVGEADFRKSEFKAGTRFRYAKFSKEANFRFAKFSKEANFQGVEFGADADFGHAEFTVDADFKYAEFAANRSASFRVAIFSAVANFYYANFYSAADFSKASFIDVAYFYGATFRDYLKFEGEGQHQVLDFRYAKIEKPDRVSFHALNLRPDVFLNVDAREFDLVNVHWDDLDDITKQIDELKGKTASEPHRLLAITYRQLATNAEENHRYEEGSRFRYWSMELWRMEQGRDFSISLVGWLYRTASGYGERIGKALFVLSMIWVTFAFAYLLTRHIQMREWYDIFKALNYSLSVMTLARPDKPAGVLTPALVTFESILGPVQAALLALAIRRKFMR